MRSKCEKADRSAQAVALGERGRLGRRGCSRITGVRGDALLGGSAVPARSDGDQAVAAAAGVLVSSNSAVSKRASRRLYSFANAGHMVKFRPSASTYHE